MPKKKPGQRYEDVAKLTDQVRNKQFKYAGKTNGFHTEGRIYRVIECNISWMTHEVGVWMTTDEYPDTTDPDFGMFFNTRQFKKTFEFAPKTLYDKENEKREEQ